MPALTVIRRTGRRRRSHDGRREAKLIVRKNRRRKMRLETTESNFHPHDFQSSDPEFDVLLVSCSVCVSPAATSSISFLPLLLLSSSSCSQNRIKKSAFGVTFPATRRPSFPRFPRTDGNRCLVPVARLTHTTTIPGETTTRDDDDARDTRDTGEKGQSLGLSVCLPVCACLGLVRHSLLVTCFFRTIVVLFFSPRAAKGLSD